MGAASRCLMSNFGFTILAEKRAVTGLAVGEKRIGGGIRETPSQWPIIGGLRMIVYRLWQDVPYAPLGPTRKQSRFCDLGSREQRRWRGQAKERCVGGAETAATWAVRVSPAAAVLAADCGWPCDSTSASVPHRR